MTKDILVQYCDMREEIKDLTKRIQLLEDRIDKIESEGAVADSVTCGKKGKKPLGTVIIKGFPYIEYSRVKTSYMLRVNKLREMEINLLELTNDVEDYINSIPDSRIRRILRFRFIDDMTWVQTAINMGGKATDESVRKECERFLASN